MAKRKTQTPPKRKGRRVTYTPAIGRAICKMLASGMTLNAVCKRKNMPHERAVRMWALNPDHPFSPNYVRAREVGYLRMADEIVEISDDGSRDWVDRTDGDGESIKVVDQDHIARARLRIETRKWLLAKALPKMFGDKSEVNVTADRKHHHTAEPLSETQEWLARVLSPTSASDKKGHVH